MFVFVVVVFISVVVYSCVFVTIKVTHHQSPYGWLRLNVNRVNTVSQTCEESHRLTSDLQTAPWGALDFPAGECDICCHQQLNSWFIAACDVSLQAWHCSRNISKIYPKYSICHMWSYLHFHQLSCNINNASFVEYINFFFRVLTCKL